MNTKNMKTYGMLILSLAYFFICSCQGQDIKKKENNLKPPKVDIKVNKKYDDDGNLIGYDSTYSYFYSNISLDTLLMDSLQKSFEPFFKENSQQIFNTNFNKLFFNDSLQIKDFFYDDFFQKRFQLNTQYFEKMMLEMDSLKNEFFLKHRKKL